MTAEVASSDGGLVVTDQHTPGEPTLSSVHSEIGATEESGHMLTDIDGSVNSGVAEVQPSALTDPNEHVHDSSVHSNNSSGSKDHSISGAHQKNSDPSNPDEAINESLAVFQGGLSDWTVAGLNLSAEGQRALEWYEGFVNEGLIPRQWKGVEIELPKNVRITFEPCAVNVLGHYHRGRAVRDGTRFNINLNPVVLLDPKRSPMQLAQTLLHEALHLCEDLYRQKVGKKPPTAGYHSVEFRRHAQDLSIPCDAGGHDEGIVAGGRFAQWAADHKVSDAPERRAEPDAAPPPARKPPKRRAWHCQCPDAVSVMVPRASVIDVLCRRCDKPLTPKDSANVSPSISSSDNTPTQEGTP